MLPFRVDTNKNKMADYFKSKNAPPQGGLMPASKEEAMKRYHEWKKTQS